MNIIFLNHKQTHCGVYQYGLRLSNILKKSSNFKYIYLEVESEIELCQLATPYNPIAIIYNYHPLTMGWLNTGSFNLFSSAKHFGIHHEGGKPPIAFNEYLDIDCDKPNGIPRPLFENFKKTEAYNHIDYIKTEAWNKEPHSPKPVINSFGFGFGNKGFGRVCKMVNDQFDEAIIRLHMPFAYYGDRDGQSIKNIYPGCFNEIKKPGIVLNITSNFLSNDKLLDFLSDGDLNLFLYDDMPDRGLSSVIDYALSVNVPLAINHTGMFRHIYDNPEICVEHNSLREIINNGITPIEQFRQKWSNENLINKVEQILKSKL